MRRVSSSRAARSPRLRYRSSSQRSEGGLGIVLASSRPRPAHHQTTRADLARASAGLLRAVVEPFRVFLFHLSPGTESIVATLRFGGLEEAEEERPGEHEVILRYPAGAPHTTLDRLVSLLD